MRFILYTIVIYFGLVLYAQLVANQSIFLKPKATYTDNEEIIKLQTQDGASLSAIYLKNPNAKYTVLISQGNYSEIGSIRPFLNYFFQNGFSVFTYDYQAYGTSTGKPTEKNSYNAINAAYEYLTKTLKTPPENIIAYGHSLGAAVSIDLATREKLGALILEAPFLSAYRVYTQIPILLFDKYNNVKKITKINCPLLVIHGTRDKIIPFWQGRSLYNRATVPKMHYWVEGADHNDVLIVSGKEYMQTINRFVQFVAPPQTLPLSPR